MYTLSNVKTQRDVEKSQCIGLASDAFPEAKSSQTGVSVRFAQDSAKYWYVLRVSYGRVQKAYDFLTAEAVEAYLPLRNKERVINGKRKLVQMPLLPNILFVYTSPARIEQYVRHTPALSYLSYYYNHFVALPNGKNPPLTVAYTDMMNFVRATSVGNKHVRIVSPEHCRFKSGDVVEVTGGDFMGVRGRVARVSGQSCVVVEIVGLCLVATAYVPRAFLRRVEEKMS